MPQRNRARRSALQVVAICALAMCGCTATMVPSQRLCDAEFSEVIGPHQSGGPVRFGGQRFGTHVSPACTSCEDRQRLQDYTHRAMPYVGGPFMHGQVAPAYAAHQATIQPPHSKFHPVPTRPVFEPRAEYLPAQPMGVQLVPIPEHVPHLSDEMEADGFEAGDTFILSPPSN